MVYENLQLQFNFQFSTSICAKQFDDKGIHRHVFWMIGSFWEYGMWKHGPQAVFFCWVHLQINGWTNSTQTRPKKYRETNTISGANSIDAALLMLWPPALGLIIQERVLCPMCLPLDYLTPGLPLPYFHTVSDRILEVGTAWKWDCDCTTCGIYIAL